MKYMDYKIKNDIELFLKYNNEYFLDTIDKDFILIKNDTVFEKNRQHVFNEIKTKKVNRKL